LLVVLHGCWANKQLDDVADYLAQYERLAEEAGVLVLVPISREHTWDFIFSGGAGREDLCFLELAINEARQRRCVDDRRLALLGLSDGASFALSLAVSNPDIFQAAMVWAAGFCRPGPGGRSPPPAPAAGSPRLFMWHGVEDGVFDFAKIAVPLRDSLLNAGYSVRFYAEEKGRHQAPGVSSPFMAECLDFWCSLPSRPRGQRAETAGVP
jgi:predicted esterase